MDVMSGFHIATRDLKKPNGILVSIAGRRVYVSENNPQGGATVRFTLDAMQSEGEA